jgi:hypothetical protein
MDSAGCFHGLRLAGARLSDCLNVEWAVFSFTHFGRGECLRVCSAGYSPEDRPRYTDAFADGGGDGLTCTAPAAYYLGTGRLDTRAFVLWAANWIFAGNQIHFVQLRIHAARATTLKQKLARGKFFLVAHPVLLMVLILASRWQILPSFSIMAFIPAVIRGSQWFLQKPEPLDVKRLGWSEMKQGVAFGLLLACALWSSRPGE